MSPDAELASEQALSLSLKVAICPPDLRSIQEVIQGDSSDPIAIVHTYIIEGLSNRGYNLSFLGAQLDGIVFTEDLKINVPARRTWTSSPLFEIISKGVWKIQRLLGVPYLNVFSNLRLLDACQQGFPGHDLVYERNTMHRFGVAMACKRLAIPYVLHFDADEFLEYDIMKKQITGLVRLQASLAMRFNLSIADCVTCVSEPLKSHLMKNWKVPAEKIIVFPCGADIQRFRPDADSRVRIRELLGVGIDPMIIFVGNFYEWHDVSTLLKAFAQVLKTHPNARLILVGDGATRQAMAQLAVDLNITHAVVFTGMVAHKDVPRYIAAADIAVVPYPVLNREIWFSPLKLFEYMATGIAIVASNVGQLPEWISDGRSGLLLPPGNVLALAEAIDRLIDDPALRSRLGQIAREEAVSKHSWEHYVERLDELFVRVSKERSANLM